MSDALKKDIALIIAEQIDFLDLAAYHHDELVLQTRELVAKKQSKEPLTNFDANYVVRWREEHVEAYADLLLKKHHELELLDILIKSIKHTTAKSIESNIKNIFADWKWI